MYIAMPITGTSAGYMAQFGPREERILADALQLYDDATEGDMSSDRPPEKTIRTAQILANRFETGTPRTVYTAAQIAIIYDALELYTDQNGDSETARAIIDAIRPAALAHYRPMWRSLL